MYNHDIYEIMKFDFRCIISILRKRRLRPLMNRLFGKIQVFQHPPHRLLWKSNVTIWASCGFRHLRNTPRGSLQYKTWSIRQYLTTLSFKSLSLLFPISSGGFSFRRKYIIYLYQVHSISVGLYCGLPSRNSAC
jgi:hypothetical protein